MEVHLRCELPDTRGMLATLTRAISEAGGDIQAIEVVESDDHTAIDDLWVITDDLAGIVDGVHGVEGVKLIHTGASRGVPGDATARLATGIDMLMTGAMLAEDGLVTLVGGLLRADAAEIVPDHDWPAQRDRRTLRLQVAGGVLVIRREYRFLDTEVQRARQLLVVCERAAAVAAGA